MPYIPRWPYMFLLIMLKASNIEMIGFVFVRQQPWKGMNQFTHTCVIHFCRHHLLVLGYFCLSFMTIIKRLQHIFGRKKKGSMFGKLKAFKALVENGNETINVLENRQRRWIQVAQNFNLLKKPWHLEALDHNKFPPPKWC